MANDRVLDSWPVTDRREVVIMADWETQWDDLWDEGQAPVFTWDHYGGQLAAGTVAGDSVSLAEAWFRCRRDPEIFERYARMFHGCTRFEYKTERDGGEYVACDPAEWRERMGITDEWLAENPDAVANLMGDYGALMDGDVYVIAVRELCDHGDWHTVDAVGGFCGQAWAWSEAEDRARELALDGAA